MKRDFTYIKDNRNLKVFMKKKEIQFVFLNTVNFFLGGGDF